MSLGMNIAALRARAGMSQDALAEKLGVSRQSVSKWETDASVPELEKLVRLAELFEVTLDELILDAKPQAVPERADPAPTPPEPAAGGNRPMTGARLAGAVILISAGAATLLGLFLAGFGILLLTVPLCVPGILCLVCKKRPALWAAWSVVLMVEVLLASATGISAGNLAAFLLHPELLAGTPPTMPLFCGALLIVDALMLLWTVLAFRKTVLPRNARTVATAAALWLLRLVILPAASSAVFRKLVLPPAHATSPDQPRAEVIGKVLYFLVSLPSLPLLAAALTVTFLLLKRREAEEQPDIGGK